MLSNIQNLYNKIRSPQANEASASENKKTETEYFSPSTVEDVKLKEARVLFSTQVAFIGAFSLEMAKYVEVEVKNGFMGLWV